MSLKRNLISGVLWTALGKYSGMIISIIISMVLARLISPEQFGVVAIAQVTISFFSIFSDLGIGAAIVQNKTLTKRNLDSIFSYTIILALILSFTFFGISPLIASFYKNPELTNVCRLLAVDLFFNTITVVPSALFNKNKRFKYIAKRSLLFQVFFGLISIIYAFCGGGVYTLVIPPIFSSFCLFIVNLYEYPRRFDWSLNIEPLKRIFSFSFYQFLFGVVNYISRNLDKLIIGKSLDMKSLGYYQKSYSLMMLPLGNLTYVITPVLQPYLSDYQDDLDFIKDKYFKMIKVLSILGVSMGIFFSSTSGELIRIFYGAGWDLAIPPFTILSLSIPLQIILSTTGSIFQSTNNTKLLFITGIINTLIVMSSFVICGVLHGSIVMYAYAWNIACIFNFCIAFFILLRFVFCAKISELICNLKHAFLYALFLSIVVLLIHFFLLEVSVVISLFIKTVVIIISILLVNYFLKDFNLSSILKKIKN